MPKTEKKTAASRSVALHRHTDGVLPVRTKPIAQGDMLVRRIDALPTGVVEAKREADGSLIVTHSETGHHHSIHEAPALVSMFNVPGDPLTSYVKVEKRARFEPGKDGVDIVHHRAWDTHATLRLLARQDDCTVFEIKRQRERTPEGWRRVQD